MKVKNLTKALLGITFLTLGLCVVNDVKYENAVNAEEKTFYLITDSNKLNVGDEIIIVAKDHNFALSTTQNTNNRAHTSISINENAISNLSNEVQVLTLENGTKAGTYALYTGSGYLYAASSSKNYLKTETTLSDNSSWTVDIASDGVATIKAQGSYTRNWLRYNSTNNPPLFSCYSSGQSDVAIYKYQKISSSYTVTFENYENGPAVNSQTIQKDCLVNEPSVPLREGYEFEGWYTASTFEENKKWNFSTDIVQEDITLYARWLNDACQTVDNINAYMDLAYKYTLTKENGKEYNLLTDKSELVNGSKIIIVSKKGNDYYALNNSNSNSKFGATIIASNEGIISKYDDTIEWTVGLTDSGYTLMNNSKYLAWSSKTNISLSTTATPFMLNKYDQGFGFANSGDRILLYNANNANGVFGAYASTNVGSSGYAENLEIYVQKDSGNIIDSYSNVEFRVKMGISKDIDTIMSTVPTGAVYGIEVSDGTTTEMFNITETTKYDDTCYYAVIGLGDVINNIERATTKFTVRAYIISEGETYYSSATKTYSIVEMVQKYNENDVTAAKALYDLFTAKGLY